MNSGLAIYDEEAFKNKIRSIMLELSLGLYPLCVEQYLSYNMKDSEEDHCTYIYTCFAENFVHFRHDTDGSQGKGLRQKDRCLATDTRYIIELQYF